MRDEIIGVNIGETINMYGLIDSINNMAHCFFLFVIFGELTRSSFEYLLN